MKIIKTESDIEAWKASKAYSKLMSFITMLNKSVIGKSLSTKVELSSNVTVLVNYLDQLSEAIDRVPPIDSGQRFGNVAFKKWFEEIQKIDFVFEEQVLKENFYSSFGNTTRLDYGTGHELAFISFLCCCTLVGIYSESDSQAIVQVVFHKYLQLVRKLQVVYRLEPAGSHGVWGLDDYQFLPFLFGSGQLIGNKEISPASALEKDTLSKYSSNYLYLEALQFITSLKTGTFGEHSPLLYDISGINSWEKINNGMFKMFSMEVLSKIPIMQHFEFNELLPFE